MVFGFILSIRDLFSAKSFSVYYLYTNILWNQLNHGSESHFWNRSHTNILPFPSRGLCPVFLEVTSIRSVEVLHQGIDGLLGLPEYAFVSLIHFFSYFLSVSNMEDKYSVARVQKSVGTYRFRIEGYSGLSVKVGESVESPEFQLCGHTWQLRIFPGGSLVMLTYFLISVSYVFSRDVCVVGCS